MLMFLAFDICQDSTAKLFFISLIIHLACHLTNYEGAAKHASAYIVTDAAL